jgi:hypothetical protein
MLLNFTIKIGSSVQISTWVEENTATTIKDEVFTHLRTHSLTRGYFQALEKILADYASELHNQDRFICPDFNRTANRCLFLVFGSFPTLSEKFVP